MSDNNLPRPLTFAESLHLLFLIAFDEQWRRVPGWPAYEVSNWGALKSYWERTGSARKGTLKLVIGETGRLLKPLFEPKTDHYHYRLGDGTGGQKTLGMAKLVLMAFDRLPGPDEHARHYYDPTPSNCHAWNLRWGSRFENAVDSIRHKDGHHLMKVTAEDVHEIRRLIAQKVPYKEIAARMDNRISIQEICHIKKGRVWTHLTSPVPATQHPPAAEPGLLPGFE